MSQCEFSQIPDGEYGFLSDKYQSCFTDDDGKMFSSVSHYMNYAEAFHYQNAPLAREILDSPNTGSTLLNAFHNERFKKGEGRSLYGSWINSGIE
jgi:hypothetical protein